MFDIGGGELLLIVFMILMLFGPKKIPEIARTLGKGMAHLRRAQAEFQRNINDVTTDIERTAGIESNPRPFRPKPAATLPPADADKPGGQETTREQNSAADMPAADMPVIRPAGNTVARTPEPPQPPAEDQTNEERQ